MTDISSEIKALHEVSRVEILQRVMSLLDKYFNPDERTDCIVVMVVPFSGHEEETLCHLVSNAVADDGTLARMLHDAADRLEDGEGSEVDQWVEQ